MQVNTAAASSKGIGALSKNRYETLTGATLAAVLGLILLWGVGLSHIDAFHIVAHDTRHSNAFPCH